MTIKRADLKGTYLGDADVEGTKWVRTICPDGIGSHNAGDTCAGHLEALKPRHQRRRARGQPYQPDLVQLEPGVELSWDYRRVARRPATQPPMS